MKTPLKELENDSKKQKNDRRKTSSEVGVRVRKLRLALGYARPAFADAVGVSASTARAWEAGDATPSPGVVDAICRTFAVDKNWLLTGSGRPFPNLMNAAQSFLLCPKSPFLRDESVPFDAKTRARTRRFVAALTPGQRGRALMFYADLVAALAMEDAADKRQSDAVDAS